MNFSNNISANEGDPLVFLIPNNVRKLIKLWVKLELLECDKCIQKLS